MCEFCEGDSYNVNYDVRSCYDNQNIDSENGLPSEWDGEDRLINEEYFRLHSTRSGEGVCIWLEYQMETNDGVIISPFSETVKWKFCPFCGRQLAK